MKNHYWVDVSTLCLDYFAGPPVGMTRVLAAFIEEGLKRETPMRFFRSVTEAQYKEVPKAKILQWLSSLESNEKPAPMIAPSRSLAARILPFARRKLLALYRKLRKKWQSRFEPAHLFQRGDTVLLLAASWELNIERLLVAKKDLDLKLFAMIYDLIPCRFPHFAYGVEGNLNFENHVIRLLENADGVLTSSSFNLNDIQRFAESKNLSAPKIKQIRLGCELSPSAVRNQNRPPLPNRPFVLSVGTIDTRKNHHLLYQVWQRLAALRGDGIPLLVFAGRVAEVAQPLVDQMGMNPLTRLNIKQIHATEAELGWLYENCLFTCLPSFVEGWALPISESMANGKVCLASNTPSSIEIGGDLLDYLDPFDFSAWYAAICRLIYQPDLRAEQEAKIRARFMPTSWSACVGSTFDWIEKETGARESS